jgi:hypothetical protein
MDASGARRLPPAALVVGTASALAGFVLAVLWLQQRIAPALLKLPPVPFFDNFEKFDRSPGLIAAHGFVALALLVTGGAILTRMRFAPHVFAACGWGGLLFTAVAAWPGDNIRGKVNMLLTLGRDRGAIPEGASLFSLIPTPYVTWGGIAIAVWLLLLVLGTVHLFRNRPLYDR